MGTPIEIRLGQDEADAIIIYRALKIMHGEGGVPGSFDDVKVLTNVLRIVQGPGSAALMAMAGDELAGVLLLWEEGFWYSVKDRCLTDKGFYILPEHRNGEAFDKLLGAVQATSNDTGLPAFITIFNAQRKRGGGSKWERRGATLGFTPRGAILAHTPET